MRLTLTLDKVCLKKRNKFVCRVVPFSPNKQMHWAERARWKKEWHASVNTSWLSTDWSDREVWGKIKARPTVKVSLYTRAAMDADNAQASLKPIYDGLVLCGALDDDSSLYVKILPPKTTIIKDLSKERVEVRLSK